MNRRNRPAAVGLSGPGRLTTVLVVWRHRPPRRLIAGNQNRSWAENPAPTDPARQLSLRPGPGCVRRPPATASNARRNAHRPLQAPEGRDRVPKLGWATHVLELAGVQLLLCSSLHRAGPSYPPASCKDRARGRPAATPPSAALRLPPAASAGPGGGQGEEAIELASPPAARTPGRPTRKPTTAT